MRQELTERIIMLLADKGVSAADISQELTIILADYEVQLRETRLAIPTEDKNLVYLQKFLISKTVKGCTDRTLAGYKNEIWKVLCAINKQVDEITADDIRLYLAVRQRKDGISKITADNELRYLRTFFSYLIAEELVQKNPVAKVDKIKCDKVKKKAFTEVEVEKIRGACENSQEVALIEVLLSTGCRVSELVSIKIADIEEGQLVIRGKGNKDRIVYLNAKAIVAIEKYLNDRKDSNPYLFPGGYYGKCDKDPKNWYKYPERVNKEKCSSTGSIESKTRKIAKKAGVKKANPHKFRRTCATFALRRGMPIEQVSKMLGHEQISTTQIYLDLSDEDLKQAHKKYVV